LIKPAVPLEDYDMLELFFLPPTEGALLRTPINKRRENRAPLSGSESNLLHQHRGLSVAISISVGLFRRDDGGRRHPVALFEMQQAHALG